MGASTMGLLMPSLDSMLRAPAGVCFHMAGMVLHSMLRLQGLQLLDEGLGRRVGL